jgi:hypothetical protein
MSYPLSKAAEEEFLKLAEICDHFWLKSFVPIRG